MKKGLSLATLILLCFFQYVYSDTPDQDPYLITDFSRLHPVKVERLVQGKQEEQLIKLVKEASEKKLKISIAGQRHSQGGHTYYKDGIVIDMTSYNQILDFDPQGKTIRVQSGATWREVQDTIHPYGLSLKTTQSQNIFTIGGSISINAHGRDIRQGSMISSVESFRLLTAEGEIKEVSRTQNAELFPLALGGYGLFGVILDVTLALTDDAMYVVTSEELSVKDYSRYFIEEVLANPDIHMHIARLSIAPGSFLEEMYAVNYVLEPSIPLEFDRKLDFHEKGVIPTKFFFNLNRSFDWGKDVFWQAQKQYFHTQQQTVISRNQAMGSESAFMEYSKVGQNDLLQEYFIPVQQFPDFVSQYKQILQEEDLNLLNITVRYVNHDEEAVLSYAKDDMLALVCLFNVSLSNQAQVEFKHSIQRVLDAVIAHQGSYYLPYAAYPSIEQFQTVYPRSKEFFEKKLVYDPNELFTNNFYEHYKGE
ncbi:FAD-binding oxidoreductase [Ammoniphilus sp. YIM 78166]|uniref:FAD-binding oxidoreductase n=1 Tax=Ammoniphilus sp. YIM 78166 TaxID=1644106 RepID=UPI00106F110F|nr:FAD-binding oxidoreductase [Ammoniphilus sp. YIM 78166]